MADEDAAAEQPTRFPSWAGPVALAAAGNALGTLIAALALFVFGSLAGVIEGVSFRALSPVVVALVGSVIAIVLAIRAGAVLREGGDLTIEEFIQDRRSREMEDELVRLRAELERRECEHGRGSDSAE